MVSGSPVSASLPEIAAEVEAFVREVVVHYEKDPRRDDHDAPTDELVMEMCVTFALRSAL